MTGQFSGTVHAQKDHIRITFHRRIIGSVQRKHRKTQYMVGSQADRTAGPNFRSITDLASFFLDVQTSLLLQTTPPILSHVH